MNKFASAGVGLLSVVAFGVAAQTEQARDLTSAPLENDPEQMTTIPGASSSQRRHCYDFSNLTVGTEYQVGDVVNAERAQIEMKQYIVNGGPSGADESTKRITVNPSNIAGGRSQPELNAYLLNMLVTPDAPVKVVTMKVAEGWAGGDASGAHSNLLINGKKKEIRGSLAQINGQIVGNHLTGRAVVVVNMDEASRSGNWVPGTLSLYAIDGKIRKFGMGGRQVNYDDVCIGNLRS